MTKQKLTKLTCTAMAATLTATPLLPLVEAIAMNQEPDQELSVIESEQPAEDQTLVEGPDASEQPFIELTEEDSNFSIEVAEDSTELEEAPITPQLTDEIAIESMEEVPDVDILEMETEEEIESTVQALPEIMPMDALQSVEEKETKSATFSLTDYVYTQNASTILITGVKTNKTAYYIPGNYNGKQVVLENLNIFPSSMTSLKLSTVNGQKVRLNATRSYFAFSKNTELKTLDLSGLDTANMTDMSYLFDGLKKLTSLNLSGWNTAKVTTMRSMFRGLKSLITLELSSFNTSKVEDVSYMFSGMEKLKTLNIGSFNTSKVEDMSFMFDGLKSLTALNVSHFKTSNVKYMDYMFSDLQSLTTLNLSSFNTAKVRSMVGMFSTNLDNNGRPTSKLTSLNIKSFNTSNLEYMSGMFQGLSAITSLDLSHFNTAKVKDMSCLFNVMVNLKTLNIKSFDTSKVEDMRGMFAGTGLTTLDLRHFDTENVEDMSYLFAQNSHLTALNLSGWNTEKVSTMFAMFMEDYSLTSLDLSSFNTPNLTDVSMMFWKVNNLRYLDMSQFNFAKVDDNFTFYYGNYDAPAQLFVIGKDDFLYDASNFKYATVNGISIPDIYSTTTSISGKGTPGTTIEVVANGKVTGTTTVNNSGTYQLMIPKQDALTKLTFNLKGKQGITAKKNVTVLGNFKNFTIITAPTPSTTTIYGTGEPGAKVNIYNASGSRLAVTTINNNGNYKLTIPKQKAGTKLTLKQSKEGYVTTSKSVTVLNELKTFTYNTPTTSTTTISGKAELGSKVGVYLSNGTRLAIVNTDNKGNYKLTIPKQKAGTVLTIKQAKTGYATLSKNVTVLSQFKTFTTPTIANNQTAIYGTGVPGATVRAYVNGKAISAKFIVNTKGNYKLTIPKQKAGTVVEIKQAKTGYLTASKKVTVLKAITTFTYNTPSASTTQISGKALAGAKVGVYNSKGTRLALVTADSKGNYKLKIAKQKAGTVLTIKQAKTGYLTLSKEVTVTK